MAKAPSLNALLAQKAALDKQIAGFQNQQRNEAIARVKSMMAEYGLSAADLGGAVGKPARKTKGDNSARANGDAAPPNQGNPSAPKAKPKSANAGKKVAPKFRNQATGDTWSGRGLKPKWLSAALASGRDIAEFAI